MAGPELGRAEIERFLRAAGDALDGEWVLVGGAAAAVWFAVGRTTADIDIVGVAASTEDRIRLMDLAVAQGLSVEAVNSAADFFLRRIDGWQRETEVLHVGARATIRRPNPTLFLLLKLHRLSEQDLSDCRSLLSFVARHELVVDRARVMAALDALPPTDDASLRGRRGALRAALRSASE
jgi:hypothetical protein